MTSPKETARRLSRECSSPEDESLDPRIQEELEKLNKASDDINSLELDLDAARSSFRTVLSDSTQTLNTLSKKLGKSIENARPYYEARIKLREAQAETQRVALKFERACSMHEAAKEMVQLAELGHMKKGEEFDPAWQEMLNHATMKVNEAEKDRNESEVEHMKSALAYNDIDQRVQKLQKELKRSVTKSSMRTRWSLLQLNSLATQHHTLLLPYFEMKARFNQILEEKKRVVSALESHVTSTKSIYASALHNLEEISDEIHRQRVERQKQQELGIRGAGVGTESPLPPPSRSKSLVESEKPPRECRSESDVSAVVNPKSVLDSHIHATHDISRRRSYRLAIERSYMRSPSMPAVSLSPTELMTEHPLVDLSPDSQRSLRLSRQESYPGSFPEAPSVDETYKKLPSHKHSHGSNSPTDDVPDIYSKISSEIPDMYSKQSSEIPDTYKRPEISDTYSRRSSDASARTIQNPQNLSIDEYLKRRRHLSGDVEALHRPKPPQPSPRYKRGASCPILEERPLPQRPTRHSSADRTSSTSAHISEYPKIFPRKSKSPPVVPEENKTNNNIHPDIRSDTIHSDTISPDIRSDKVDINVKNPNSQVDMESKSDHKQPHSNPENVTCAAEHNVTIKLYVEEVKTDKSRASAYPKHSFNPDLRTNTQDDLGPIHKSIQPYISAPDRKPDVNYPDDSPSDSRRAKLQGVILKIDSGSESGSTNSQSQPIVRPPYYGRPVAKTRKVSGKHSDVTTDDSISRSSVESEKFTDINIAETQKNITEGVGDSGYFQAGDSSSEHSDTNRQIMVKKPNIANKFNTDKSKMADGRQSSADTDRSEVSPTRRIGMDVTANAPFYQPSDIQSDSLRQAVARKHSQDVLKLEPEDDFSDTDSVTSGPVMDDDAIDMLTLTFDDNLTIHDDPVESQLQNLSNNLWYLKHCMGQDKNLQE